MTYFKKKFPFGWVFWHNNRCSKKTAQITKNASCKYSQIYLSHKKNLARHVNFYAVAALTSRVVLAAAKLELPVAGRLGDERPAPVRYVKPTPVLSYTTAWTLFSFVLQKTVKLGTFIELWPSLKHYCIWIVALNPPQILPIWTSSMV